MAMNMWQKAWAMIKGTANDAVDASIDPATMMRQGIREMDAQISDFEKALVDVMAQRNLVQKQYEEQAEEAQEWKLLAGKALENGNETDAREAAKRAITSQEQADQLTATLNTINTNIAQLKSRLEELRNQKDKAEIEVKTLDARTQAAQATIAVQSTLNGVGGTDMGDMMALARKKADEKEAKASAMMELATNATPADDLKSRIQGGDMSSDRKVEELLAQMRIQKSE